MIEKYAATHTDARVVIFSESKSFEPLDVFSNKGYELILDGDVGEGWKTIMVADVIILSKSSFSYVPAALSMQDNNKTRVVVCTEFWHKLLPGWERDDDMAHVKQQLRLEKKKMRGEQCTEEISRNVKPRNESTGYGWIDNLKVATVFRGFGKQKKQEELPNQLPSSV